MCVSACAHVRGMLSLIAYSVSLTAALLCFAFAPNLERFPAQCVRRVCHICAGTGLTPAASEPGLGSPINDRGFP